MSVSQSEFVRWMGPILDALRELGGSGKPREVCDFIATREKLSDKKLEETLKSGQTRYYNQVHWARQYLVWEELLDGSTRGVWSLTPAGYKTKLDILAGRKIFLKWVKVHAVVRKKTALDITDPNVPTEIELVTDTDHKYLLLELLKKVTPEGFEHICARLLRESGFEKVTVTGGPKDEGIDGLLFQCKRYKGSVSRAQVGDFRNAMLGRADKGIIMTTGTFTADARHEADRDGAPPIELVDGEKLVELFERVNLGLQQRTVYEIDHAFFAGFMPSNS
jgi:restriction system protein